MAAVAIDLTQGETMKFYGSSEEDINYAKSFWQSVQLEPPMESRLVSSDIKQRLKVAQSATQSATMFPIPEIPADDNAEFFVRAQTLQHLEQVARNHAFSRARDEDRAALHKRREERKEKEKISNKKKPKAPPQEPVVLEEFDKADEGIIEEDAREVLNQINDFEKSKHKEDSDSD